MKNLQFNKYESKKKKKSEIQNKIETETRLRETETKPSKTATWARFLAPNPKGLGAYNLGSVRTYVRPAVQVYGSNSLRLYTKIRYGLRIMHVK